MENKILLPSIDATQEFVNECAASEDTVLVSREGFKYQIDGASLLGMMHVVGVTLLVKYYGESLKLKGLIEKYSC